MVSRGAEGNRIKDGVRGKDLHHDAQHHPTGTRPCHLTFSRLACGLVFIATGVSFASNYVKVQGQIQELVRALDESMSTTFPGQVPVEPDKKTKEEEWPPWPQYTAFDYNYSTKNRGKIVNGHWRSQRNKSHIPPLFLDRLDMYLGPECPPIQAKFGNVSQKACDDHVRLFPEDIQRIEEKVMKFSIPRKIVFRIKEGMPYINIQHSRWNLRIDSLNKTLGTRKMCPNCHIRNEKNFLPPNPNEPAHVRFYPSCQDYKWGKFKPKAGGNPRDFPGQILIGDCGESQYGSGKAFWTDGKKKFDYDSTVVDQGGPFVRTYAHLHLAPGFTYEETGLPAFRNVTDFARHLLTTPVPSWPRHLNNSHVKQKLNNDTTFLEDLHLKYEAAFLHGDCGHQRGILVKAIVDGGVAKIARYGKCFHNIESNAVLGGGYWAGNNRSKYATLIHKDQEGHRDATKVALMSHHKFGFALENTLSPYYFTEKRWQVLIGNSVPIVWNNHNSIQFLPDPDAALVVPTPSDFDHILDLAKKVGDQIHYYAQKQNEQEYLERFFAWKHRGLRPDFVRKLFMSTDFVFCRICEYVAHHHFYNEEE